MFFSLLACPALICHTHGFSKPVTEPASSLTAKPCAFHSSHAPESHIFFSHTFAALVSLSLRSSVPLSPSHSPSFSLSLSPRPCFHPLSVSLCLFLSLSLSLSTAESGHGPGKAQSQRAAAAVAAVASLWLSRTASPEGEGAQQRREGRRPGHPLRA